MYGCTSPLEPIVKHVNLNDSLGLKEIMETAFESNMMAGV